MRLRDRIQPVIQLWGELIEPVASVQDGDQRRQSRLLAGLMLSISIVIVLIFVPQYLLDSAAPNAEPRLLGAMLGLVVTLITYVWTRRGNYLAANTMAVTATTVLLFLTAAIVPPSIGLNVLYYTIILTLFSSLFLPIWFTTLLGISHIVGMTLLPLVVPVYTLREILEGPATFSLLLMLIALVFSDYRTRLEKYRRGQLAESENRYRIISQAISDYAFSYQVLPNGEITREWLTDTFTGVTGYDTDEFPASNRAFLYHPDDMAIVEADLQATIGGQTTIGEYRIIAKDGRTRWMMIYRYPIWDAEQNRVVRYFGAAQDITERKENEAERLKMALQRERLHLFGGFMEAVSHDFRTSLATIETSRYLIEQTLEQPEREKQARRLGTIQQSVHHVAEQIENLNTLSSLLAPNMRPQALNPLIQDLIGQVEPAAAQKGIEVRFTADERLPVVMIDSDEFQRAIKHLLTNAVNFTPPGGRVTVRSSGDAERVEVEIRDTGQGIDQHELPHIFNHFYRADPSRPTHVGGIGVGLSIVKMIVEAHSGTIQVESRPGKGSTFRVSLPVVNE